MGSWPAFWQQSAVTMRYVRDAKYTGVASIVLPKNGQEGRIELDCEGRFEDVDTIVSTSSMQWQESVLDVTSVYADGGVFRPRRCEAGSWAWVGADRHGRRRCYQYGWMEAAGVLKDGVTNNISEFAGLLKALEAMPLGWSGTACTDSEVTLGRFRDGWRLSGIPRGWETRMLKALDRLGDVEYVLLKGHPTPAEVAAGEGVRERSGRRYPASEHQVFCDDLCTRTMDTWGEMSGSQRDIRTTGERDGGSVR